MTTELKSDFDPIYDETFDNTHELYTRMRAEHPVAYSNSFGGFWAAFKYDDVVRIQTDHETFITSVQNVVPGGPRNKGRRPPLHFDPPEHATYRRPTDAVFGNAHMSELEPGLNGFANELLEPLLRAGQFDFTLDFAEYFAAQSFGLILNLPLDMMLRARQIGVQYYRASAAMDMARTVETSNALYGLAVEIVSNRKSNIMDPKKDLVSSLLLAGETGNAIPEDMVIASVRQFLSAAQAAPGAVLGSIAVHLARDSTLQTELRQNPGRLPGAIEEFLRLYAPYRVFARTPTRDVEIGGRIVKEGEPITMMFPSANRDEDVFENPHEFNMDRKPNKHIAFGRGPHQCPASSLARMELRIGIGTLLAKTQSFELSGPVKMTDWVEFGPSSTPLSVVPA